jgi:hypothetical protein
MPKKTEKELEELVNDGEIIGFTLDTTEFHHLGYDFDTKSLKALAQFADTEITVVFSEVVLNEVQAHVRDDIKDKAARARSQLRQIIKAARLNLDLQQIVTELGIAVDPSGRSSELLDSYVAAVGAKRVEVDDGATVRKLHDLYFSSQPPFSSKIDKKNEFLDAIALLSLEHWAAQNGGYLLAVSNDSDWSKFAETSDHLICVSQLTGALNLFNRDDAVVAARLAANLMNGTAQKLSTLVTCRLEAAVEIFDVEANAPYHYESEDEHGAIDNWVVESDRFDVIASDADSVTVAFTVSATATFYASFSFEVHDSVDKDYITIGGTKAAKTDKFDTQMFVTIARDDDENDPDIVELESESTTLAIDFGYVEVDYGDDRDEW